MTALVTVERGELGEQAVVAVRDDLESNGEISHKADPKKSNRQVAKTTGVSDKTIAGIRNELEGTAEIPQLKETTGADGKDRPTRHTFLAEVAAAGFLFRGISPAADGSFVPDDAGREACVLAVHYRGEPVDAVAWFTNSPARWWTLCRTAELLGDYAAFVAETRGKPLLLVETPHRWLQAWGDGCACIVDWSVDPRMTLTRIDHVACESEQLATKLREAGERHNRPRFKITTAARGARHAA